MFTSFPGPASRPSPSTIAFDGPRPGPGILRDALGNIVDDRPDDQPIPHGWMISRRLTALDADVTFGPSTGMDVESAFECLPRGLQRRRHMVEVDLAHSSDNFTRAQAMRLCEVLVREIQSLGDLAAAGHVPWDSGTPDAATLQAACKSARDYLAGYADSALRMMGRSPASASNGVGAAGDRAFGGASVSDEDRAAAAHAEMRRSISDGWRSR
jgi:hypothetical protein